MSYGVLPPLSSVTYGAPPLPTSDTQGTPPVVTAPPTRMLQSSGMIPVTSHTVFKGVSEEDIPWRMARGKAKEEAAEERDVKKEKRAKFPFSE